MENTAQEGIPELVRDDVAFNSTSANHIQSTYKGLHSPLLSPMAPMDGELNYMNNKVSLGGLEDLLETNQEVLETQKSDELEVLWPGVHHELIPNAKRTPSFYMMLGFIGGAVVSLAVVGVYSLASAKIADGSGANAKSIVIAKGAVSNAAPKETMNSNTVDPSSVIVPVSSTYEVKTGDTLASIALTNYKKVTPRLIDAIVEHNKLKSAHMLGLGQKLNLPPYQTQTSKLASGTQDRVN